MDHSTSAGFLIFAHLVNATTWIDYAFIAVLIGLLVFWIIRCVFFAPPAPDE
jgi:hypothetical protein